MNEETAEADVVTLLQRYDLHCERPSKDEQRRSKTPDFKVTRDGRFCFYVEVKSIRGDEWLDGLISKAQPGQIAGGEQSDPVFNRLTDDIHTAVKQFDAVNPDRQHPNVLALVNQDDICGYPDLLAVITGQFFADDGSRHAIYRKYSEGRIRGDRQRIDLYVWLGIGDEHHFLFTPVHQKHHSALCRWFNKDPAKVKVLDF